MVKLKIVRHGGLQHLTRVLRLSDEHLPSTQDAIFVSIDLEVSRQERTAALRDKSYVPHVKELCIACLDTRNVFAVNNPSCEDSRLGLNCTTETHSITTHQFSTSHSSKDFEDCDITDFKECVFADTFHVHQHDPAATIIRYLRIQDSTHLNTFRKIVITGHSVKQDCNIIQRLGIDINRVAPIIAVIDTHSLSRYIIKDAAGFSLSDILTRLQCPYNSYKLHNSGNDSTYTLYVTVLLAVKWATGRDLAQRELANMGRLQEFIETEFKARRWEPVRRAFGARSIDGSAGSMRSESKPEASQRNDNTHYKTLRKLTNPWLVS